MGKFSHKKAPTSIKNLAGKSTGFAVRPLCEKGFEIARPETSAGKYARLVIAGNKVNCDLPQEKAPWGRLDSLLEHGNHVQRRAILTELAHLSKEFKH